MSTCKGHMSTCKGHMCSKGKANLKNKTRVQIATRNRQPWIVEFLMTVQWYGKYLSLLK